MVMSLLLVCLIASIIGLALGLLNRNKIIIIISSIVFGGIVLFSFVVFLALKYM